MSFTEITWGSEKYKFNNDTMIVYDKNDKKVGTLVDGNIISITTGKLMKKPRAKSTYDLFKTHFRPLLKKEFPDLNPQQLAREITKRYNESGAKDFMEKLPKKDTAETKLKAWLNKDDPEFATFPDKDPLDYEHEPPPVPVIPEPPEPIEDIIAKKYSIEATIGEMEYSKYPKRVVKGLFTKDRKRGGSETDTMWGVMGLDWRGVRKETQKDPRDLENYGFITKSIKGETEWSRLRREHHARAYYGLRHGKKQDFQPLTAMDEPDWFNITIENIREQIDEDGDYPSFETQKYSGVDFIYDPNRYENPFGPWMPKDFVDELLHDPLQNPKDIMERIGELNIKYNEMIENHPAKIEKLEKQIDEIKKQNIENIDYDDAPELHDALREAEQERDRLNHEKHIFWNLISAMENTYVLIHKHFIDTGIPQSALDPWEDPAEMVKEVEGYFDGGARARSKYRGHYNIPPRLEGYTRAGQKRDELEQIRMSISYPHPIADEHGTSFIQMDIAHPTELGLQKPQIPEIWYKGRKVRRIDRYIEIKRHKTGYQGNIFDEKNYTEDYKKYTSVLDRYSGHLREFQHREHSGFALDLLKIKNAEIKAINLHRADPDHRWYRPDLFPPKKITDSNIQHPSKYSDEPLEVIDDPVSENSGDEIDSDSTDSEEDSD